MNYQTVGMLIMLGALGYLWLMVNRLSGTVRILEQRALPPVPTKPTLPVMSAADALDEGVVAAIAAAVAVVVRVPHRIVAVHPDYGAQHAWSAEGRREIYLSHKVR
jgi:hypothetical protein